MNKYIFSLKQLQKKEPKDTMRRFVLDDILNEEEPLAYIQDVLSHGCQSGIVSGLIYYKDTHNFFDKYYGEIQDCIIDLQEMIGEPIDLLKSGDIKNHCAWLAYEETVRTIAGEIEMEY